MTGLDVAAGIARVGDKVLDVIIGICLVLALLYGGFGLWDTWRVMDSASSGSLKTYKPATTDGGSNLSLQELAALNSDVCGWLTVDGTDIDYPVVRGVDNVVYLNRDVMLEYSLSGSIFLDYRNAMDFTDSYSVVYGHHMEGNVMFGELPQFVEADYFNSHTTGTLYLLEGTYHIEWFASMYTDAYDYEVFSPIVGQDATALARLQAYLQTGSRQYRDIGVGANDRIIALSTCESATTNGRVLLFGRLSG